MVADGRGGPGSNQHGKKSKQGRQAPTALTPKRVPPTADPMPIGTTDTPLLLQSPSRSFDGAVVALEGMTAAAKDALGREWRLVGGLMTLLSVRVLAPGQPDNRFSADADLGVDVTALGGAPLLAAMEQGGFKKLDGSRLQRVVGDVEAHIDVIGAATGGRFDRNVRAGDFVVDVTPGLQAALALPPRPVSYRAVLTDGSSAGADGVLLPHPIAALAMKVYAWRSLQRPQDADDVAALLRAVSASGDEDYAATWSQHPDLESARMDLRKKGRVWAPHMIRDAGWASEEVAELKYAARSIT